MSTIPRKYAVPAGSARSRLLIARAARYTGCAVRERERLDGLDTHPASQTSGRFCYSIGKTRDTEAGGKTKTAGLQAFPQNVLDLRHLLRLGLVLRVPGGIVAQYPGAQRRVRHQRGRVHG